MMAVSVQPLEYYGRHVGCKYVTHATYWNYCKMYYLAPTDCQLLPDYYGASAAAAEHLSDRPTVSELRPWL